VQSVEEAGWETLKALNPVQYYEAEIRDYENGCGYWTSVFHGVKGAVAAATDVWFGGKLVEFGVAASSEFGVRARLAALIHELQTHPVWSNDNVRDSPRKASNGSSTTARADLIERRA
jgi:hypothetical protein